MKLMQDRKGVSIAYFNAVNSAIALVTTNHFQTNGNILEDIIFYRDFFLEEYAKYHKAVIQSIGANYKAEDAIKKFESAESYEEVSNIWKMLSEDERRDGEIRKVVQKVKAKFGK